MEGNNSLRVGNVLIHGPVNMYDQTFEESNEGNLTDVFSKVQKTLKADINGQFNSLGSID